MPETDTIADYRDAARYTVRTALERETLAMWAVRLGRDELLTSCAAAMRATGAPCDALPERGTGDMWGLVAAWPSGARDAERIIREAQERGT